MPRDHLAARAGSAPRPLATEWHRSVGRGRAQGAQEVLQQHHDVDGVGHTERAMVPAARALAANGVLGQQLAHGVWARHPRAQLAGLGQLAQFLQRGDKTGPVVLDGQAPEETLEHRAKLGPHSTARPQPRRRAPQGDHV